MLKMVGSVMRKRGKDGNPDNGYMNGIEKQQEDMSVVSNMEALTRRSNPGGYCGENTWGPGGARA